MSDRAVSGRRRRARQEKRAHRTSSNIFSAFTQQEIQEFKEAFNLIDQNHDGFIDHDDLIDMLTSLGASNVDNDEVAKMLGDALGPVNFTMFLTMFSERLQNTDPGRVLLNAFRLFDEQQTGFIDEQRLRHVLTSFGNRWTQEMVDELYSSPRLIDGRGFNYVEFVRRIKGYVPDDGEETPGLEKATEMDLDRDYTPAFTSRRLSFSKSPLAKENSLEKRQESSTQVKAQESLTAKSERTPFKLDPVPLPKYDGKRPVSVETKEEAKTVEAKDISSVELAEQQSDPPTGRKSSIAEMRQSFFQGIEATQPNSPLDKKSPTTVPKPSKTNIPLPVDINDRSKHEAVGRKKSSGQKSSNLLAVPPRTFKKPPAPDILPPIRIEATFESQPSALTMSLPPGALVGSDKTADAMAWSSKTPWRQQQQQKQQLQKPEKLSSKTKEKSMSTATSSTNNKQSFLVQENPVRNQSQPYRFRSSDHLLQTDNANNASLNAPACSFARIVLNTSNSSNNGGENDQKGKLSPVRSSLTSRMPRFVKHASGSPEKQDDMAVRRLSSSTIGLPTATAYIPPTDSITTSPPSSPGNMPTTLSPSSQQRVPTSSLNKNF